MYFEQYLYQTCHTLSKLGALTLCPNFFLFVPQETLKRKEAEQEKRLEMAAAKLEEARSQTSFLKDQMAAARVEADLQVWFGQ
jgi:hypothetical protein